MFTKREIIELFDKDKVDDINEAVNYILTKLNLKVEDVMRTKKYDQLKVAVKALKSKFVLKWKVSSRNLTRFQAKNAVWLESEFQIPNFSCPDNLEKLAKEGSMPKPGRPNIAIDKKSQKSQRRDAATISNQNENNPQRLLMSLCCKIIRRKRFICGSEADSRYSRKNNKN